MELANRTVIVTGAGGGIGRALALAFGREGANVVCTARRKALIEETASLIDKEGGSGVAIPTDVTCHDQVKAMVQETLDRFGQIDVLFNNAGSFQSIAGVWEVDVDLWWTDVTVNLLGPLLIVREILPHMMERNEGIIINMNGGRPTGGTGYACGKAGLMELNRILVEELATVESSVIILGAGPGLVRTEMTELQADTEAGRRWIPSTRESLDAGATRRPEEIARATIEMVQIARPALSGTYYGPDTDVSELE